MPTAPHIQWHTAGGSGSEATCQPLLDPQSPDLLPGPGFIAWNHHNVFKTPARI
ncbi:MAG: hypothetical protein WBK26_07105 [Burkholderiaceae bacterium]